MKIRTVAIDFKKNKKVKREVGLHCVIYYLYFMRIWLLDETILKMLKKSHDSGLKEGRKIYQN